MATDTIPTDSDRDSRFRMVLAAGRPGNIGGAPLPAPRYELVTDPATSADAVFDVNGDYSLAEIRLLAGFDEIMPEFDIAKYFDWDTRRAQHILDKLALSPAGKPA